MSSIETAAYTAHIDTFTRDSLPPPVLRPDFLLDGPDFAYPARLNAVAHLVDHWVAAGRGAAPAVRSAAEIWSYGELQEKVNRIANVLVRDLGVVPGNRVLLRAPNNPLMFAAIFAVMKAGGVAVPTMPLLRAKELGHVVRKAEISLALCDHRLMEEMEKTRELAPDLKRIVSFGGAAADDLTARMRHASADFAAVPTAADDVAMINFTSGTTGEPKGAMHFHRSMLATCDSYGRHVLQPKPDDVFVGTPPLAFSFGFGCLALFPMRVGASTLLIEMLPPDRLVAAIRDFEPTTCITAPTAYRAMLGVMAKGDTASLHTCVSAGEALPRATWDAWRAATGLEILDGIGSTEMLHIFIGAPRGKIRSGSTGLVVPGYEAKVIDDAGKEALRGSLGRLAVRGPTGCLYLADERQKAYVENGWNVTGDTYIQDADGYFWYQARNDDMIISAGYNIAGPEVEGALLTHPAVAECGVVAAPDAGRGMIVKAYVVLHPGHATDAAMTTALQAHVKAEIAPYKYPRAIEFVDTLPRTGTGKLQRFALREHAKSGGASTP